MMGKKSIILAFLLIFLIGTQTTVNAQLSESYFQDFSSWENIIAIGDSPDSWITNSDPAEYQSTKTGTFGTYINLVDSGRELHDEDFSFSWDVMFTATGTEYQRRFLSIWCYFSDGSELRAEYSLWDSVKSVWLNPSSDANGTLVRKEVNWESSAWSTIAVSAKSREGNYDFSLYFNHELIGTSNREWNNGTNLDFCAFYAYQNNWGLGDSMYVDNFNITGGIAVDYNRETPTDVGGLHSTIVLQLPFQLPIALLAIFSLSLATKRRKRA